MRRHVNGPSIPHRRVWLIQRASRTPGSVLRSKHISKNNFHSLHTVAPQQLYCNVGLVFFLSKKHLVKTHASAHGGEKHTQKPPDTITKL